MDEGGRGIESVPWAAGEIVMLTMRWRTQEEKQGVGAEFG